MVTITDRRKTTQTTKCIPALWTFLHSLNIVALIGIQDNIFYLSSDDASKQSRYRIGAVNLHILNGISISIIVTCKIRNICQRIRRVHITVFIIQRTNLCKCLYTIRAHICIYIMRLDPVILSICRSLAASISCHLSQIRISLVICLIISLIQCSNRISCLTVPVQIFQLVSRTDLILLTWISRHGKLLISCHRTAILCKHSKLLCQSLSTGFCTILHGIGKEWIDCEGICHIMALILQCPDSVGTFRVHFHISICIHICFTYRRCSRISYHCESIQPIG